MDILLEHIGQGMWLILLLSLPATLLAASIGLVVGILQAVTQVQEQTISAAPKILCVFLLVIFGGGIMMTLLERYMYESAELAFNVVPQQGNFILPPKPKTESQIQARKFFKDMASGKLDKGKTKALFDQAAKDGNATAQEKTGSVNLQGRKYTKPDAGIAEKMILKKEGN